MTIKRDQQTDSYYIEGIKYKEEVLAGDTLDAVTEVLDLGLAEVLQWQIEQEGATALGALVVSLEHSMKETGPWAPLDTLADAAKDVPSEHLPNFARYVRARVSTVGTAAAEVRVTIQGR